MKTLLTSLLLYALTGCSSDSGVVCLDAAVCGDRNNGPGTNTSSPDTEGNGDGWGLSATHRSGQTFLLWDEPDSAAHYHVYRSNQPITTDNLSSATLLTSRWGPVDQHTSVNKYATDDVPGFFVVEDLGAPLDYNTGLFVHTVQTGEDGAAYYAVTAVINGSENKLLVNGSNTLSSPVDESVNTPQPVLTVSMNDGKGRIYTQYMDYVNWNPTLNGYAFNYTVAVPFNYNPEQSYPLQLQLHVFGATATVVPQSEFGWQVIQVFPNDPGEGQNAIHTWWYGHSADHNYLTDGAIPFAGRVENFTEQRILSAVNEVIANSNFNVNTDLVHAYGNSMGASGVVSLGMRYPAVFAGIYASEPMTNYATNPLFQENLRQLWGEQSQNLPIVNRGSSAQTISKYGSDGSQPTGVWDWMNHQLQLRRRTADDFAYLNMDFGKSDNVIDWLTQGRPMLQALTDAKAGFSATALAGTGHDWLAFNAVNKNQFGLGENGLAPWRYPRSLSFVSLQNASGSGQIPPGLTDTDEYNINIEWSTPHNAFHQTIVDNPNRYAISLRSLAADQTVSVTPRNTQAFRLSSGQQCNWTATSNSGSALIGSGSSTVDSNELVTAVSVPVNTGPGTRLDISCL